MTLLKQIKHLDSAVPKRKIAVKSAEEFNKAHEYLSNNGGGTIGMLPGTYNFPTKPTLWRKIKHFILGCDRNNKYYRCGYHRPSA